MKYIYLIITIIGTIYLAGNLIGYNYLNQNGVGIKLDLFYQIFFIGIPLCITIASGYFAFKNLKVKIKDN